MFSGLSNHLETILFNSDLMQDSMLFFLPDISISHCINKLQVTSTSWKKLGVISKVSQPTTFCAEMLKHGKVHICVDLKPLNHSVLREVYPLPLKAMRHWHGLVEPRSSQNWATVLVFGKFSCHKHHASSLLLLLL